jgi:hypothetical protein
MTLMRMPLSVWGSFVATIIGLLAVPAREKVGSEVARKKSLKQWLLRMRPWFAKPDDLLAVRVEVVGEIMPCATRCIDVQKGNKFIAFCHITGVPIPPFWFFSFTCMEGQPNFTAG